MSRPPSALAHRNVLEAALELFSERGIDSTSMDAIAEVSGVSKATIYKHWADKDALCIEALMLASGMGDLPPFDTGDLRRDLIAFLEHRSAAQHAEGMRRLMPHFMAYAARNAEFRQAWKARAMEPPRARLKEVLARGVKKGELPRGLNLEVAVALILGPMVYRFALEAIAHDLPEDFPTVVADAFLKAYGVRRKAGRDR